MALFIFLIFLLLVLSAFFSGSETALFSLSHVQLHHLKERKFKRAQQISTALQRPRRTLITILLGNELVNVAIAVAGAALVSRLFVVGTVAETLISIAIITPLVLIFGEVLPKNIALRYAPQYAHFAIVPLRLFSAVVRPIRVVLTWFANFLITLMGGRISERPLIMEREYRRLVDIGRREGVLIEEERELIHNVFEFSEKTVSSIMTPADKILSLPTTMPYEEILAKLRSKRFSRIPFHKGTRDNIAGILHVRDLFAFDHARRAGGEQELTTMLRDPLFVNPNLKLEDLLQRFRQRRMHMAIVKEKDGPLLGIVTMDDVLEDLFGEIEI
jgi:putative hemolysin